MIQNAFGAGAPARRYRCVICDRETEYWGPLPSVYPFCGPRCKLIDLGRWLREEYSIERDLRAEDLPPDQRPPAI